MGLKHGGWNKTQKILLNLLATKGSEVLHAAIYDYLDFGPSGVRALPLAAGINVGGHYKWHFSLSPPLSSLSHLAHC